MLKAVLFDLDQTLIDWDHVGPWENYQLQRMSAIHDLVHQRMHPLPDIAPENLCTVFMGQMDLDWKHGVETLRPPNVVTALAATLRTCGVPEERLDVDAVMEVYFNWPLPEGERAYPDARDVLTELRAHGIELGIITNASHPMVHRDRELEAVGLLDLFPRCRLSAIDVGVLKPHRAIFDHALNILGIRPEEALFIGDNLSADVEGAQGAGIPAVWINRTPDSDMLSDITPDGTIYALQELLPLLDHLYPGWRNGHSR
jgi:putative hydrolase of the HAD superfamily